MVIAGLATLVGIAVLLSLAYWQAQRLVWKEALIADLNRRLAAPPVPLPSPAQWTRLSQARDEFTRVTLTADLRAGQEALVFTNGSGLRPDVTSPGYWVFRPATVDGATVVIDRGFVPEARKDPASRSASVVDGPVQITGLLRWPEPTGAFTPDADPAHNLWFVRDHAAMARAKGWGTVAPFYIEQETPANPGGLPRVGKLVINLPNNHLQYELTWAGLALVLAAVYGVLLARWWRTGAPGGPAG